MGKTCALATAIVVLVVSIYLPGWAATWYVDDSVGSSGDGKTWGTAFKKIQEGIDAASDGDTVIVAEGTYVENVAFNGKNMVLRSTEPANVDVIAKTIIDGNEAGSVVTFSGKEENTCVLAGFTIQNGSSEVGGGICGGTYDYHTHALIENNTISGNATQRYGSGLAYCDGVIQHNRITQNFAAVGGTLFACHGTIRCNAITGNSAGNWGGGVGLCDGLIQNNVVSDNSSEYGGGLDGCGGLVQNNVVTGNRATKQGGGLASCLGTVQDNPVSGNFAGNRGGGLSGCGGSIQNNTVVGNSADEGGGLEGCHAAIRNCIIWGNVASGSGDQILDSNLPSFCCIQDWAGSGTGNISDDPIFADEPEGDYHVEAASPCIGTGTNFYWFAWPNRDLDGNCRLYGSTVDMGCYEYGSTRDADGDLLCDSDEEILGTRVLGEDTDGDGLRDGVEVLRRSDPLEPTSPGVVYVPEDVERMQQALCFAINGEKIVVAAGTFQENIQFCGADVILRSSDPQDPEVVACTILDGRRAGPVVAFYGNESAGCVLSGFTIRGGAADSGGGIDGGMWGKRCRATIQNNVITGNVCFAGGGGLSYCDGTIENNIISGNIAGWDGGGLNVCAGTIQNNIISGNSSDDEGGGLWKCNGTIKNNVISGNVAGESGGGLAWCEGVIEGNKIIGNGAGEGGWELSLHGGGLAYCKATIRNNLIAGNLATGKGGALISCNGTIENNTVAGNRALTGTGGIHQSHGEISNCIIWANMAPDGVQVSDSGEPKYSCIEDWIGGGEGNIADDPRFVKGDYRLQDESPCMDAGLNEDWMLTAVDLDGNPRIWHGRSSLTVDMGAYEFGSWPFRILRVEKATGREAGLVWSSRPGDMYAVWSCEDLVVGSWTERATVPSQGLQTFWTDESPLGSTYYYRVEAQ